MSGDYSKHPFLLTAEEAARALGTDLNKGLTSQQVAEAQQKYPKNEFEVAKAIPWYTILSKQLFNAMVLVCCRSGTSFQLQPLKSLGSRLRHDPLVRHQ